MDPTVIVESSGKKILKAAGTVAHQDQYDVGYVEGSQGGVNDLHRND